MGGGYGRLFAQHHSIMSRFNLAYQEMADMLEGKKKLSIKWATYLAENAYLDGALDYERDFCQPIRKTSEYLYRMIEFNHLEKYKTAKQMVICNYFFFPCSGNNQQRFEYDFSGEYPDDDWHYQLVSRTIKTHKGQCRSLPWLFMLIAEEMGAKAYIAHAPRHCLLMYKDEDNLFPEEWVNVSLTSQQYPMTSWIKSYHAIKDSAIKAGTYLTPLTAKQMVATQLNDLAIVYVNRFKRYDKFTLKCAEMSLKHYQMHPNAIIVKGKSIDALLKNHLKQNGYRRDAYTDKMDAQSIQCWKLLQSTHWTQETPELRKRWKITKEESDRIKNGWR